MTVMVYAAADCDRPVLYMGFVVRWELDARGIARMQLGRHRSCGEVPRAQVVVF